MPHGWEIRPHSQVRIPQYLPGLVPDASNKYTRYPCLLGGDIRGNRKAYWIIFTDAVQSCHAMCWLIKGGAAFITGFTIAYFRLYGLAHGWGVTTMKWTSMNNKLITHRTSNLNNHKRIMLGSSLIFIIFNILWHIRLQLI